MDEKDLVEGMREYIRSVTKGRTVFLGEKLSGCDELFYTGIAGRIVSHIHI